MLLSVAERTQRALCSLLLVTWDQIAVLDGAKSPLHIGQSRKSSLKKRSILRSMPWSTTNLWTLIWSARYRRIVQPMFPRFFELNSKVRRTAPTLRGDKRRRSRFVSRILFTLVVKLFIQTP